MNYLLDTHVLLWAAGQPELLPVEARTILENPQNKLYFSSASIWEISIKNSLGRADFRVNTSLLRRSLLDNHYEELAIFSTHALLIESLPLIHKDPFDRMLIAQSMGEGFTLLTSDTVVASYFNTIKKV